MLRKFERCKFYIVFLCLGVRLQEYRGTVQIPGSAKKLKEVNFKPNHD